MVDSQEKPTNDSCKTDSGSAETPPAPTMHKPHVSEPQLGVATVDGEEPLRGRSSFQDKCINGEQRGKLGQEPFPEGRGGGHVKLDNVTRGTADVSSVWDSFDVSTIRESQESLPGEFVHLFVACVCVCYRSRFVYSRLFLGFTLSSYVTVLMFFLFNTRKE